MLWLLELSKVYDVVYKYHKQNQDIILTGDMPNHLMLLLLKDFFPVCVSYSVTLISCIKFKRF